MNVPGTYGLDWIFMSNGEKGGWYKVSMNVVVQRIDDITFVPVRGFHNFLPTYLLGISPFLRYLRTYVTSNVAQKRKATCTHLWSLSPTFVIG